MKPITTTATMMRASELELPFWNSSHTNLPRPGFCASISAAINTIQPIPSDRRRPVNIIGMAEGSTILTVLVSQLSRSTLLTLIRSLLTPETPTAVLMMVGHRQHSVTVIAEFRNDFENQGRHHVHRRHHHRDQRKPGQRRHRLEHLDDRIEGLIQRLIHTDHDADRDRDQRGDGKTGHHSPQAGEDLVDEGRLAGVLAVFHFAMRSSDLPAAIALSMRACMRS